MTDLFNTDLAYLAGIFDAEGSISVIESSYKTATKRMPRFDLAVNVVNTDKKVLQWILSCGFGGAIYEMNKPPVGYKQCFTYAIRDKAALGFLTVLLPYLKVKKQKAELAIAFQARKNRQEKLWNRYDPIPVFELNRRKWLKHLVSSAENSVSENKVRDSSSTDDLHQIAYFAGFFDGEGCVSILELKAKHNKQVVPRFSLRLSLPQNDRGILMLLAQMFGGYVTGHQKEHGSFRWSISDNKAAGFLRKTLQFLRVKRDQALVGIDFSDHKAESSVDHRNGDCRSILSVRKGYKTKLQELKRLQNTIEL